MSRHSSLRLVPECFAGESGQEYLSPSQQSTEIPIDQALIYCCGIGDFLIHQLMQTQPERRVYWPARSGHQLTAGSCIETETCVGFSRSRRFVHGFGLARSGNGDSQRNMTWNIPKRSTGRTERTLWEMLPHRGRLSRRAKLICHLQGVTSHGILTNVAGEVLWNENFVVSCRRRPAPVRLQRQEHFNAPSAAS